MTWRYQATHRAIKTPAGAVDVFEVREVYGLNDDGKLSWTKHAIPASSETREGLIEVLQRMLRDVRELNVLEVDEGGGK